MVAIILSTVLIILVGVVVLVIIVLFMQKRSKLKKYCICVTRTTHNMHPTTDGAACEEIIQSTIDPYVVH